MALVLLFGTFDIIHEGHRNLLKQASQYGDVHVILARDITIMEVKGRSPHFQETIRQEQLQKEEFVHQVHLGSLTDKFQKIKELRPDTIILGYDQSVFVESLYKKLLEFGLSTKVIRGKSYKKDIYKSSLLRYQMEN